jgi:hypothetical protein
MGLESWGEREGGERERVINSILYTVYMQVYSKCMNRIRFNVMDSYMYMYHALPFLMVYG